MSACGIWGRLLDRRRRGRLTALLSLSLGAFAATSLAGHSVWARDQGQTAGLADAAGATDKPASYLLGPRDKVRVRAVEWRQSQSEVFEWKVLNQDYVVDADGSVSVPLVGDVPATGLTKAALGQTIGERLRSRLGLESTIDVNVEIVECRPFYVMGNVNKPGEYSYRPGMTVVQAVSIAGGYLTNPDHRTGVIDENEMLGAVGLLSELTARKDRLTAEMNGTPLQYSQQWKRDPQTDLILSQEQRIFDVNRDAERKELQSLRDLEDSYNQSIALLDSQLQVNEKTVALSNAQMSEVASLRATGLTTLSRELEVTLQATQLQQQRMRLQSEVVKARQELSKTRIDIAQLESRRTTRAAQELRETQAKMNDVERSFALRARLVAYAGDESAAERTFKIIRPTAAGSKQLVVAEDDRIQPGDVLEVSFQPRSVPDYVAVRRTASGAAAASNVAATHE